MSLAKNGVISREVSIENIILNIKRLKMIKNHAFFTICQLLREIYKLENTARV